MAYVKTDWENGVTPINETNLNKIENELETLENGSIVDMGTNANGTYIKYGNGLMITYQDWEITNQPCTTSWGSLFTTGDNLAPPTFPETFYSVPNVSIEKKLTSGQNFWIMKNTNTTTTSAGNIQLIRGTSNASISTTLCIIAIGTWK